MPVETVFEELEMLRGDCFTLLQLRKHIEFQEIQQSDVVKELETALSKHEVPFFCRSFLSSFYFFLLMSHIIGVILMSLWILLNF